MTMKQITIAERFEATFKNISAYAIQDRTTNDIIGRVVFKHGDNVRCWLYINGCKAGYGTAGGGGYDRATAALGNAAQQVLSENDNLSIRLTDTLQSIMRSNAPWLTTAHVYDYKAIPII